MLPDNSNHPQRCRRCQRCPATIVHTSKLVEHRCAAGKDVCAQHCEVCAKTSPWPECVRQHAEREHTVPADWASCDYSYHHPAAPHCTVCLVPVYACLLGSATHLPWRLRAGPHHEHIVSFPLSALLPLSHSGFSQRSRALPDRRSYGDLRCSVAAC